MDETRLTDEQCNSLRSSPVSFNDMLRAAHDMGWADYKAALDKAGLCVVSKALIEEAAELLESAWADSELQFVGGRPANEVASELRAAASQDKEIT